jgi:phage-related tail protein
MRRRFPTSTLERSTSSIKKTPERLYSEKNLRNEVAADAAAAGAAAEVAEAVAAAEAAEAAEVVAAAAVSRGDLAASVKRCILLLSTNAIPRLGHAEIG